jgi:hypothetical protein
MTQLENVLITLASACANSTCPTVYLAEEDDMLVVQGYSTSLETPEGESAVRIPTSVVNEAMTQLAIRMESGNVNSGAVFGT